MRPNLFFHGHRAAPQILYAQLPVVLQLMEDYKSLCLVHIKFTLFYSLTDIQVKTNKLNQGKACEFKVWYIMQYSFCLLVK